eukprot:jgi/Botrbrau1/7322/Bobra.247_3s0017.1
MQQQSQPLVSLWEPCTINIREPCTVNLPEPCTINIREPCTVNLRELPATSCLTRYREPRYSSSPPSMLPYPCAPSISYLLISLSH